MTLWTKISSQFGKPTGFLGKIAGIIMGNRKSNLERINGTIELLDIKNNDNILEIGFGPGVAINIIAKKDFDGKIYGIDHSELMFNQASKRNEEFLKSGKAKLFLESVQNLPKFEILFDKVFDINSFQFRENPKESLINLKKYIKKDGLIMIVHQPRKPGSTDQDTTNSGNEFANILKEAGFNDIKVTIKPMKPVSTVFVVGRN